jgi:hypothetical protein
MSEQKFDNKQTIRYESLSELNLISLWSLNGNDWSSLIKEEIQAANNQPIEAEEPNLTNKVTLLGVLVTLALLVAAVWIRTPAISQAMRETATNSVKELILRY